MAKTNGEVSLRRTPKTGTIPRIAICITLMMAIAQAVSHQPPNDVPGNTEETGVGRGLEGGAYSRAAAGALSAARDPAIRSLANDPLNAGAVHIAGLVADTRRDAKQAQKWASVAGLLGWRHTPTQLWLIDKAARSNDFRTVVERSDALLRRGELAREVNAVLWALASHPAGIEALVERLGQAPLWRRGFLDDPAGLQPELRDSHDRLLGQLISADAAPARDELASYLRALTREQDYARAFRLWQALAPAGRGSPGVPFDGTFSSTTEQAPKQAAPFEWTLKTAVGASGGIETAGSSGARLVVRTDGSALATVAEQLIRLPPGRYSFSVEMDSPDPAARAAFDWTLRCLPSYRRTDKDPMRDPRELVGGRLRFTFTVPAAECPVQMLQLNTQRLSPPAPTQAAFDNVRIGPTR